MELLGLRNGFTATLPATRCSEDLIKGLDTFAEENDIRRSDAVRHAILFFLSHKDTKSIQSKTQEHTNDHR